MAKGPQINFLKFYGGWKGDVSYFLHAVTLSYRFEVAFDSCFYTSVFDFSGRNHLNKPWVEITFFRWSVTKNWLQTKNSIITIDCEINIFRKIFVSQSGSCFSVIRVFNILLIENSLAIFILDRMSFFTYLNKNWFFAFKVSRFDVFWMDIQTSKSATSL